MSGKVLLLISVMVLLAISCNVGDPFSISNLYTTAVLQFDNLPVLENNYHYEGWALIDNQDRSLGKFKIDQDGNITDIGGVLVPEGRIGTEFDMSEATQFKISIEEDTDANNTPSGSYILIGNVSGFSAVLSVSHQDAVGVSFTSSTGQYLLATPSTTDTNDEKSGIWFMTDLGTEPTPGLDIPDLETDWVYEGWITINNITMSTGQFDLPGAGDSLDEFTGTEPIPFLPGEDFVTNAPTGLTFPTDLSGAEIKITLEADKDDDRDAPSKFIVFTGQIPTDAVEHSVYSLTNESSTLPSGTIALYKDDERR
ncbi:hypothetical protein ACFL6G_10110 [candidate division KSB1 bacterium]